MVVVGATSPQRTGVAGASPEIANPDGPDRPSRGCVPLPRASPPRSPLVGRAPADAGGAGRGDRSWGSGSCTPGRPAGPPRRVTCPTRRPLPLGKVMSGDDPFPGQYLGQPVSFEGTWLPEGTLYVADRDLHGKRGYWVMTPGARRRRARCPSYAGGRRSRRRRRRAGPSQVRGWLQASEGAERAGRRPPGRRDPGDADRQRGGARRRRPLLRLRRGQERGRGDQRPGEGDARRRSRRSPTPRTCATCSTPSSGGSSAASRSTSGCAGAATSSRRTPSRRRRAAVAG